MIKNETFLQGEGVPGSEGHIDVTRDDRAVTIGGSEGEGCETRWLYRCSNPAQVRYLGQVIIDAGDALEERRVQQTEGDAN